MKSDNSSAQRRRALVCPIVILTALLTLSGTGLTNLWAGSDKWIGIGPFVGSLVGPLAVDPQNPDTLYAGTSNGLFKSTNGGATWNSINSAIEVISLAIDPRTPGTLYAGTYGVFKSIDGGVNWTAASSGLATSSNGGDGPYWDVRALAIDPQNPATLYAGTGRGLFKSQDGGASWNAAGAGLPTHTVSTETPAINRLVIDPQHGNTIYAVGDYYSDIGGGILVFTTRVFKTTDAGANWNALTVPSSGPTNSISTLVIDPQKPTTLYAVQSGPPALTKSTDGGATWSTVSATIAVSTLAIDPQNSTTLYAATVSGLLKSTDGGTSWTAAQSGLPGGIVLLVIDPQHPGTVYATGSGGLFKTTDGGANWIPINSGLTGSTLFVPTLLIDPKSNSIYAGTGWSGLFVESTDGGSNWSSISPAAPYFWPSALAIDPQNSRTLYAGGSPGAIFKTTDGGGTWTAAYLPGNRYYEIYVLAIDPQNPATLYAGTFGGIFKSMDGGATWNAANIGISISGGYISTLVIDPNSPSTLYASGSPGVFKSTDGGASWNALNIQANHSITILAIDPQNSHTIYAGGFGAIFKSTDSGTNWTAAGAGLPNNPNWMAALVIDPQNPSTLYAGTSGMGSDGSCDSPCSGFHDGVFKSTDGGGTWTALNSGLTATHVFSLAIDPNNSNRLYAGTMGGGVFAITFAIAPVVTDFRFDQTNVAAGGSYAVTVSGSSLTPQTFFDVRFSAPGSGASAVVLNWQKGLVVSHNVPAGIAAGAWTITGVRAHELEADHTDSFVPVSATITVSR